MPELPTGIAYAYAVIHVRGGLFGVYLHESTAHTMAQATNGVVVRWEVVADYRTLNDAATEEAPDAGR